MKIRENSEREGQSMPPRSLCPSCCFQKKEGHKIDARETIVEKIETFKTLFVQLMKMMMALLTKRGWRKYYNI